MRISVGTPEQNDRLLVALREILGSSDAGEGASDE